MTNKEKFLALVSVEDTGTSEKNRLRIANRASIRESQGIAMKILDKLEELNWSQKDLATKMDVSPQQVNKIVKGTENLTLTTLIKLQTVLDLPLLASFFDTKFKKEGEFTLSYTAQEKYTIPDRQVNDYQGRIIRVAFHIQAEENKFQLAK